MVIGRVKFIVSTTQPKPNEVDYWIDILEDPYGSVIRTWNGVEWRRIDQDAVDAIENFSQQLLQLNEKINDTILELNTLTGEVRVLQDNLEQHVTNLNNPHNITKEQIGLGNVDNTSDLDKPIPLSTQQELDKIPDTVVSGIRSINQTANTVTINYGINKRSTNEKYTGSKEIPVVTQQYAGILSSSDKIKLDSLPDLLNQHTSDNSNPHNVNKQQIGLGNVTNDSQVKRSEMGVANGVATLNEQGLVPQSQLPSYVDDVIDCYATYNKAEDGTLTNIRLYLDQEHQNAISGESSKIYVDITNESGAYQFRWTGTQFAVVGAPIVIGEVIGTAFDGKRGKDLENKTNAHIGNTSNPHNVTKAQIGLQNVDNTSDANKPISNATQSALDNKQNTLVSGTNIKTLNGESLLGSGDIQIQSGGVGKVDPNSGNTGEIFNNYENNKATGQYSHAEGYSSKANGDYSHAEGISVASGRSSHAEGINSQAIGHASHAEGSCSGGANYYLKASGQGSHVEGYVAVSYNGGIEASGSGSHAEGYISSNSNGVIKASGSGSHAEGFNIFDDCHMIAQGDGSHIQNVGTVAKNYGQTSMGCFNEDSASPNPTSYSAFNPALIIGNGTSSARGNAFKVLFNGQTFADGQYSSSGADYAEMFEWKDGNPSNEDRVGRFVTLKGKNIEIADETSNYILGVVSGAPTIIGDNPMRWQGKYLNDEWGRPIYEDVEVMYKELELNENGEIVEVEKTRIDHVRKVNPNYDPMERYTPRIERSEWDYIGMMGKLFVRQDGTLTEGCFCKPSANGVATAAESGYYVMEIINKNQALILFR